MSITAPTVSGAPVSRFPSAASAWWMIAVFSFTALISYSDRLILSVLVDPIRAELGLSDSTVGFLQGAAFTVVYVLAALVFGRLADRRRRKALLITGVLGVVHGDSTLRSRSERLGTTRRTVAAGGW
jgi:MFS family permease